MLVAHCLKQEHTFSSKYTLMWSQQDLIITHFHHQIQRLALLCSFSVLYKSCMVFYFQGKDGIYCMHINSFLLRRRRRQSTTSWWLDSLQHALQLKYSLSSVTSSVWSASVWVEEGKPSFHFRIFQKISHSHKKRKKIYFSTKPVWNKHLTEINLCIVFWKMWFFKYNQRNVIIMLNWVKIH